MKIECIPIQGSGTYAVEAMLGSFVRVTARFLCLPIALWFAAAETLDYLGRSYHLLDKGDYLPPRGDEVAAILATDPAITHVLVICETSSGILNPVAVAAATRAAGRQLLVDSMSAFGAVPISPADIPFEAMVSSANKCIEGVPGFGFVFARKDVTASKGNSHSLSLDVHAQWAAMEKTGQWRFTPPTHVVAAFLEAMRIFNEEGGVTARGARYARNRDVLVAGMRENGFETLRSRLAFTDHRHVLLPRDAAFTFTQFYELMKTAGFIYPGKLTVVDSFRIGCIGRMDHHVMADVVGAAEALKTMGVASAAHPPEALAERRSFHPPQPLPEGNNACRYPPLLKLTAGNTPPQNLGCHLS